MKIVLAPDKFKGSLTGIEFCDAVGQGIASVVPTAQIIKLPLADGGDGTIEVANYYLQGDLINTEVNNPFFQKIRAAYLYDSETKTAFIEMAEASGIKILKPFELDCMNATTFGTGELILNAINRGAKSIILGIGGSATNDCGIGMATALGYKFISKDNKELLPIGKHLSDIVLIDDSEVHPQLKHLKFKIASDVSNPLYGKNGAAKVYAKQKGASQKDIEHLDKGLQSFSNLLDAHFKIDSQSVKGAGAAGGMGIGAKTFLNAEVLSGIELMKQLANFEKEIENADWIITGEGKLDSQTLSGKTIKGVINNAKKEGIKIAAFCGQIDLDKKSWSQFGISYSDEVLNYARNFDDAISNTKEYIYEMAIKFAETL